MTNPDPVRQMTVRLQGVEGTGDHQSTFDVPQGSYNVVDVLVGSEVVYSFPVELVLGPE